MTNIILIVLDSVRRDYFSSLVTNFSDLKKDFVEFSECKSIYTETPRSFYTIFYGDYFNTASHKNFFSQLKESGYSIKSFCNGGVVLLYPLLENIEEQIQANRPFRDEIINDLEINTEFEWKLPLFGNAFTTYYGAADDEERDVPKKWKHYLNTIKPDGNVIFFHFWRTHHNYDLNEILAEPIEGDNYRDLGQNLINQIKDHKIRLSYVQNQYRNKIQSTYNDYILKIFNLLKRKGIYDDSIIIITADHGEGLGDIGSEGILFSLQNKIFSSIQNNFKNEKILACLSPPINKWDMTTFFHAGGYELQKEVPLWIKFPNNEFSGHKYVKPVSVFDIIHTINDELGYIMDLNVKRGTSLKLLLNYGDRGRDKYLINLKKTN